MISDEVTYVTDLTDPRPSIVGQKARNLALVADIGVVPPSRCLTNNAFAMALTEPIREGISRVLNELRSNKGYGLAKASMEIQSMLADLVVPPPLVPMIWEAAREVTDDYAFPLIVRSSGFNEDSESSSGAGVNVSVTNIQGPHNLLAAILECWKGSFDLASIAHRLRTGELELDPLPGLIIQRYIANTSVAGVCCSPHPILGVDGVFVEYSRDGSSGVESGLGKTDSFFVTSPSVMIDSPNLPMGLSSALVNLTLRVRHRLAQKAEIEWCFDGRTLYLVQARPVIARYQRLEGEHRLVSGCYDLYRDAATLDSYELGDVAGIYRHSVIERRPIRMFAMGKGILVNGTAVVIGACHPSQHPALNQVGSEFLVIDAGPYLRSLMVPRTELDSTIERLIAGRRDAVTFIVREFLCGEYAAIAVPGEEGIVLEVCRGSLIGLNRGFASADTYLVTNKENHVRITATRSSDVFLGLDEETRSMRLMADDQPVTPVSHDVLIEIAEFTRAVQSKFGVNSLEWTIVDGRPIYIDNTPLDSTISEKILGTRFLSGHQLKGKITRIANPDHLREKSSGPTLVLDSMSEEEGNDIEIKRLIRLAEQEPDVVVVTPRPFTALSPLVGGISGFICEQGPALCHLAIISREAGTPIAVVSDAMTRYQNGEYVELRA
ncbi:PEP/pyruvate-binding domain-containing protein [Streptomyces sp. NPDC058307]|uniref:PEP/pyruvate-binding domain-containing protein n=1 Tax=Streptomyces sp. NPDC058307 TaxID=3346439 RepID=UPI0036E45E03